MPKKSGEKIFKERMWREGRRGEWDKNMKEEMAATGKGPLYASRVVSKKMGYHSLAEEELLAKVSETIGSKVTMMKEITEETKAKRFEDALATLPSKASEKAELDWIRSHPAMARRARQPNKMDDILITVDDILHVEHGPAPSKAAVFALQHWANSPTEFFKQILGEQKKKVDEEESGDGIVDMGIVEVKELLEQMTHRRSDV